MAAITAQAVMQLREQTGAGMMQCKAALTEADGNMEEAKVILRKKLGDKAVSRGATRTASEGLILTQVQVNEGHSVGAIIELNCETDFVARNPDFKALGRALAQKVASFPAGTVPTDLDALLAAPFEGGQTIGQYLTDASAPLGEKVALGRFERFGAPTGNTVAAYVHNPGGSGEEGGKIGVLIELTGGDANALTQLGRELAQHIAAANPAYRDESEIPAEILDKEREVARAQAANDPKMAGKPAQVIESMVNGRVRKFTEETVLLKQAYVRDPAKTVAQVVGGTPGASVVRFTRFRVGETAQDTPAEEQGA
jgi:elongation factor Ts